MALIQYSQARPWAKAIRDEVLARRMPPWGAVRGFGALKDDESLTQDEIMRIAEWVEGGAPEGDPKFLPALPALTSDTPVKKLTGGARTPHPPALLTGVRPSGNVATAKVFVQYADGSREPLIWLRDYKADWNRVFLFQYPVRLRPGSRVVIEPPAPMLFLTGR